MSCLGILHYVRDILQVTVLIDHLVIYNFKGIFVTTINNNISRLESQYRPSHLANHGLALVVAYAEVTAVSGNVDIAVAVELIASVEAVLAAMLTCSQSNIHSHGH